MKNLLTVLKFSILPGILGGTILSIPVSIYRGTYERMLIVMGLLNLILIAGVVIEEAALKTRINEQAPKFVINATKLHLWTVIIIPYFLVLSYLLIAISQIAAGKIIGYVNIFNAASWIYLGRMISNLREKRRQREKVMDELDQRKKEFYERHLRNN